jgi:hypothetical protein
MRSRRSEVGVRADGRQPVRGRMYGEGGTSGAEVAVALRESQLQEQWLPALDGCVMGVKWPLLSEKLKLVWQLVLVNGVDRAGESALRKSV